MTKKQKGFTLIELMLVLAGIVALTIIAFITYPKVQASNEAAKEAQIWVGAITDIRSLYTPKKLERERLDRGYNGLQAIIPSLGVFPKSMTNPAAATPYIINRWGGAVNVNSNGSRIIIQYSDVPSDVCKKLIPQIEGAVDNIHLIPTTVTAAGPARWVKFAGSQNYDPSLLSSCGVNTVRITTHSR